MDVVPDAPKRSELLNMIGHTGYSACQFCESPGQSLTEEYVDKHGQKKMRHIKLVYPANTDDAPPRDSDKIREMTADVTFASWPKEDRKGINGRSLLADFKNNKIDLVMDVQVSYHTWHQAVPHSRKPQFFFFFPLK